MIVTPQLLWNGYDPFLTPLNATLVSSSTTADASVFLLYFNGDKQDNGCMARIFARLYVPKNCQVDFNEYLLEGKREKGEGRSINSNNSDDKQDLDSLETKEFLLKRLKIGSITPNCVAVFDDIDKDTNAFDPKNYLNMGFSVLVVDYGGMSEHKSRFTIYPKCQSLANYFLNPDSDKETDVPQNSSWYIWQTVAMRSVVFCKKLGFLNVCMLGVGLGLEMPFKTSYFDGFITAGATQFTGGVIERSNTAFIASLDCTSYASNSNCPIFIQGASNEQNSSLDALSELYEIAGDNARFSIIERSNRNIDKIRANNPAVWFKRILSGAPIYNAPKLSAKGSQNKLYYNIDTNCSYDDIESVSLYVAHIQKNPAFRNWRKIDLQSVGATEYLAHVPIIDCSLPVYAFCNVSYKCGLVFSSLVLSIVPKQLNITAEPLKIKRLIYDTSMGLSDFLILDTTTASSDALSLNEGAVKLKGVTSSTNSLTTFKLADPQFTGPKGANLQIMAYSKEPQTVKFIITTTSNTQYIATRECISDTNWTKKIFACADFKSSSGALVDWQNILTFEIKSESEFLFNSMLWA